MAEDRSQPKGQGTAAPAAGGDPSMEDILASIRRILNEEDTPPAAGTPPPEAASSPPEAEEPLTLSEEMLVEEPAAPAASAPAAPAASPQDGNPVTRQPSPAPAPTEVPPAGPALDSGLIAPAAAAAAAASLGQLLRAVASERGAAVSRGGPTIEDVVREELRPMLKEWLDQHLPEVVERLVRAEIERVVGRALS